MKKKSKIKTKPGYKFGERTKSNFKLHYRKEEEKFFLEEIEFEIDRETIRRISIDSVHSPNKYRLLVAKYQADKPIEELINTRNWNSEYSIMVYREDKPLMKKGNKSKLKERIDREEEDIQLKRIPLIKEDIVEGRVFIIFNGLKFDFTNEAREAAKWQYEKLLQRE